MKCGSEWKEMNGRFSWLYLYIRLIAGFDRRFLGRGVKSLAGSERAPVESIAEQYARAQATRTRIAIATATRPAID